MKIYDAPNVKFLKLLAADVITNSGNDPYEIEPADWERQNG